ncbi:MAG: nucleoside recognition domain-containing protein [Bacillota bacterium]|nr:nucleoside recognition domain-containing protein [Bacillota bacterium]
MTSRRGRRSFPLLPMLATLLALGVVTNPVVSLAAARRGIHLWWTAVLPSLLPFFILSDLLQATGVVKALGVLLEPLMRPLFALPGAAGVALVIGFTSGPPSGARAAARLTSAGLCSPEEGSRLAAFANVAGPLFVTGVTAVSLFHAPAAAPVLALVHYGAALLVGLIFARLPSARRSLDGRPARRSGDRPLRAAWRELGTAAATAPPLGQLLGTVVREGGEAVLLVGGFIIFFSVLIGLLEAGLRLPAGLPSAGLAGLLEVTAGLSRAASSPDPLPTRLAAASALLAWSGLSIHAQAAAVSASAGLSYRRFLEGRLLHVALSSALFSVLWPLAPVFTPAAPVICPPEPVVEPLVHLRRSVSCLGLALALLTALGLGAAAQGAARRFYAIWVPRSRPRP